MKLMVCCNGVAAPYEAVCEYDLNVYKING